MTTNNNHIVITAGYKCNSNCVMCSVASKFQNDTNSTTEEIIKTLKEGRTNNATIVDFSGGEPTLRKDLRILILRSRMMGYKEVVISTNGLLLSDKKYCDELIDAGLNNITFSLHAPNQKINKEITDVLGGFDKTITGIKNAINNGRAKVNVVTVVQQSNYSRLSEIGNLIYSFGVQRWIVCDVAPLGIAKVNYAKISVKRKDVYKSLIEVVPLFTKMEVLFSNFTQCTLPQNISENNYLTISKKLNKNIHKNYFKDGEFKETTMNDGTLKKINICKLCKHSRKCTGFWSDYFNLYGEDDMVKLAIKNNCLK